MSVLSKITVGDVEYHEVDCAPTHTAPKGTIAIDKASYLLYLNNDGGSTWIRLFKGNLGEMHFANNSTARLSTEDSWFNLNNIGWSAGTMDGFSLEDDGSGNISNLRNNVGLVKVFVDSYCTVQNNSNDIDIETGPTFNNIVPTTYQGGSIEATDGTISIRTGFIDLMEKNDYVNVGMRYTAVYGGGPEASKAYEPKHHKVMVRVIDTPRDTDITEDWESGDFTTGGWTVVNGSETNQWVVGSAEASGGTYSAYVSNDSGTTASYTATDDAVVHFYKDITFPSEYKEIWLIFNWKCWGENSTSSPTNYDYGTVVITDTGTTPTLGTEVSTSEATGNDDNKPSGNGRIGAATNDGKFNERYGGSNANWHIETIDMTNYKGLGKRLVFTWKNDASVKDDPPFVVDNIKLVFFA